MVAGAMKCFYHEGYDYGRGLPGEPREIHGFASAPPAYRARVP